MYRGIIGVYRGKSKEVSRRDIGNGVGNGVGIWILHAMDKICTG